MYRNISIPDSFMYTCYRFTFLVMIVHFVVSMIPKVHFGLHIANIMQHVPSKILDIDCSWQFIVLYLIKKDSYHFIYLFFFPAEISYSYLNPNLLSLVTQL